MAIEVNTNNPLGLTTAGPGYSSNVTYPGQIGTQTSGLGYTFAAFPDQATGIAAGIGYITNKISSGAVTTVGQLVNKFSPNDQAAFTTTTGLNANDPLNVGLAGLYAAGIAAGEGTLSSFGGVSAFTGGSPSNGASTPQASSASPNGQNFLSEAGSFFGLFTANNLQRGTFIFVGIGLLFIGGLILLASDLFKTVQENPGAVAAIAA